jgi:hypothetical protein
MSCSRWILSTYLNRATHDDLHARVVEVKKTMLTALHRKLTADG